MADTLKTKPTLIGENALLRQQLIVARRQIKRAHCCRSERISMTMWARLTRGWQGAILLVQPDTVLRWHRDAFRFVWRVKSRRKAKKGPPTTTTETIELIRMMAMMNRLWGAEKIRGELLKLGIRAAKRTIQKYMRQARKATSPGGQKWATFLKNHAHEFWACDFVQSYDIFFRQIFAFVIVKHDTREVVYHAVTYHPTAEWTAQQLRNATFDESPRFIIRDGDGKFGSEFGKFDTVAKGADIKIIRSLHPNMNPICERFVGSLRRECLDHFLILGEDHLGHILREYAAYFNKCRPHQGIAQRIPKGAANDNTRGQGDIVARPILGGLHHHYGRAA